jgi:hypothetical protein
MALKYLSNIDLGGLQIQNAKPYVITTTDQTNLGNSAHASYLGTAGAGQMYYNSMTTTFLVWGGTTWITLDGSGDISSVSLVSDSGTLTDNAGAVSFTISGDTGISTTASGSTLEIDLDDTAVTAGIYGSSTSIPNFTVDAQGRLTDAGSNTITVGDATITIAGGSDLEINTTAGANGAFTTNQGTNETITLDHSDVTRTDASNASTTLAFGGTLTPFTALGSSSKGHVTSSQKTVFTLPSLGTTSTTALAGNTDVSNVSNAHLLTALAALESSGGAANQEIVIGTDAGDTIKFTGSVKMDENSSFIAPQFTFEDTTSGKPLVIIKNTNDDAAGSILRFEKHTNNSAADDDEIGSIEFFHDNSAGVTHQYAQIVASAEDVTEDDELGHLSLNVSSGHTTNVMAPGLTMVGHATDGRVDVTLGNGIASTTIVRGDLMVAGSTTTVNSTELTVADLNVTVASNATTSSATDGAGLTFGAWSAGTIPNFTWDHSNTRFNLNKNLNVVGNITLPALATVDGIDISEAVPLNTAKVTNVTTNLSATASGTSLWINSSDGTNASVPAATTSAWGAMTDDHATTLAAAQDAAAVRTLINARVAEFTISGDGSTTEFTKNHNWNTVKVMAEVVDYGNAGSGATYATVHVDTTRDADNVIVTFAVAPTATQDYLLFCHKVIN